MSDQSPSATQEAKPVTVPADNSDTGPEQEALHPGKDYVGPSVAQQPSYRRNDRPYGFAIAAVGVIAAVISAVLVGVLIFQTLAVYNQLKLSRETLESSNESFQVTLIEMRQQRDAMTAQVESMSMLTTTLEQIFRDQQRARMSFRVELEQIDDVQTGFRIVCPFEIGGTTEALQVRFKNYVSDGNPGQHQFLESLALDWNDREPHPLTDVAPTEVGRRFITPVLSEMRMRTIVSEEKSLYFVGRLEYCDVYGACRYFMRCAEFGHQPGVITYCGTRLGDLNQGHGE